MENSILLAQMNPETLRDLIRESIRAELETLTPPQEETRYLTRSQVCELLHISLPTLGEYQKHGLIIGRRFGRRVLYDQTEIKESVKEIPSLKYNRSVRR